MAEFAEEMFEGFSSPVGQVFSRMSMSVDGDQDDDDLSSSISSNSEGSNASAASSSLDFAEDGTSSTSSSSFSSQVASDGPLYELSSLMVHLPIKRGLSKYFQGKSQSFTSLSNVRSIEDLAKREVPYGKKMKSCKSFAGGLDCHRSYALGTCTRRIAKKGSKGSCSSLMPKRNNSFIGGGRPPSHAQRNY